MVAITRMAWSLWRLKWGVVRLAIALTLLGVWLEDNPARLARLQLSRLPDMDYIAEADKLRKAGRFADALVVINAAEEVSAIDEAELTSSRNEITAERDSVVRRVREFSQGVLFGTGDSIEAICGAIGSDFLIVGDIRDLLLESAKLTLDGEADEFILALSAVGVLSTLQPYDWLPALLRIVRKAGGLSKNLAETILHMCHRVLKGGDPTDLLRLADNIEALSNSGSLSTAVRVLRHIDDPAELEVVARFARRHSDSGFALLVTGEDGVQLLTRSLGRTEDAVRVAARKGNHGVAWLRTQNFRLLRPHPLVGLLKSWRKGNLERAAQRFFGWIDPKGWIIVPALAMWVFLEASMMWRRLVDVGRTIRVDRKTVNEAGSVRGNMNDVG